MNRLGYDAATLGNHEFDYGQAYLGRMIDSMDFEVVCANALSDTCTFPHLAPAAVIERGGVKVGFVGGDHQLRGSGASGWQRILVCRGQIPRSAAGGGARRRSAAPRGRRAGARFSHMGDDRDRELLAKTQLFDVVIGGHTHVMCDTVVNGTLLTQTGKDLHNVGATVIRLRGKRVVSVEYRLVPLDGYAP